MNFNIPDNLMDNVEKRLRNHVKERRRKRNFHRAAAAVVSLLILLPMSAFAYAQYNDSILYRQEIDLARENKDVTKVNKTFKYKNVNFTIKEIVADDTGMEVIYDVSDSRYAINNISFGDKDSKVFGKSWGYTLPYANSSKEKSFCIMVENAAISDYMRNNPVTIKVANLEFSKSGNLLDKIGAFFRKRDSLKVDWTLKMQIPMQKVKVIPVNKKYSLDIGTLKLNSFKVGVLKNTLDYSFIPKDKSIMGIHPLFSLRYDKKYIMTNGGGYDHGDSEAWKKTEEKSSGIYGNQEFDSIYYKKVNTIGIKLIAIEASYNFNNPTVYKIDKNNLPMEFDCNGEKFKVTSMQQKVDSMEYNIQLNKTDRIFHRLNFDLLSANESKSSDSTGNIQYIDQSFRDKLYNLLTSKVPNLKDIEKSSGDLQKGIINTKITIKSTLPELMVTGGDKVLLYDEDEVILNSKS